MTGEKLKILMVSMDGYIDHNYLERVVQVISSNSEIKSKPNNDSDILAAETGVLLNLERCFKYGRISSQNIKG